VLAGLKSEDMAEHIASVGVFVVEDDAVLLAAEPGLAFCNLLSDLEGVLVGVAGSGGMVS